MVTLEISTSSASSKNEADDYYKLRSELAYVASSPSAHVVGEVLDRERFSTLLKPNDHIYCDWPSKQELPLEIEKDNKNLTTYGIPEQMTHFSEAIGKIAAHEHAAVQDTDPYEIHIEARQWFVRAGNPQREALGKFFHRDLDTGYWGHIYMISDVDPTEFLTHNEPTDKQYLEAAEPEGEIFVPEPFEIVRIPSPTFHRSPRVAKDVTRTFLRVTYLYGLDN